MNGKRHTLLPILQSSLPALEKMLPYFKQIETNRCHSNFGPLHRLFEERLAEFFNISTNHIALSCNGTLSLVIGLLALNIPRNKYCLMPAWTFSATPAAAILAGLEPFFLDVDPSTQQLTPEHILNLMNDGRLSAADIGAVIVVSPFGAPVVSAEWDAFTHKTNIPVIIDAAASFDTIHNNECMQIGNTPMMVSLHGTKIFGIGEGGFLVSTNEELIKKAKGLSNFGFDISRVSSYAGTNAKLSEFGAAIGLTVLDAWPDIRERRLHATSYYIQLFKQLGIPYHLSPDWLSSTCNILLPGQAMATRDYLVSQNIESRIWWGKGCHTYPAYENLPREFVLSHTDYLSNTLLGIPFSIDISHADMEMVVEHIAHFLQSLEWENEKVVGES